MSRVTDRFDVSYTAAARRALEVDLPEDTSAATLEFIDEVLRGDPKRVGEPVTAEPEPEYAARVGDYWVTYRVVEDVESRLPAADSGDDDDRVDDETDAAAPIAAPTSSLGIPARRATGPVDVADEAAPLRRSSGAVAIPRAGRVPSDPSPIIRRSTGAVPLAGTRGGGVPLAGTRGGGVPLAGTRTGEPPLLSDTTPPLPTQHRAPALPTAPLDTTGAVDRWFEVHGSASLWVLPVMLVAAVVTGLALAATPTTATDDTVTGLVWNVTAYGQLAGAASWWQQSPLGWLQLAAWVEVTDGFGRWGAAVLAVREAMIPVAAATAGLVWLLGRRVGVGRIASTAAALVVALAPIALTVHATASAENVGAVWLLLAMLVATVRRRPIAVGVVAGVVFAVAVLSAQPALLALPVIVWMLVRSTGRLAWPGTVVAFAAAAVLTGGLLELVLSGVSSDATGSAVAGGGSGLALWWTTDPALLVVCAAAAVYALLGTRLRPIAALAAGGLVALAIPGFVPATGVALVLPFAAIAAARVADEAVRAFRLRSAPRRIEPVAVLAVVGVAAVITVSAAIARIPVLFGSAPVDAADQAEAWLTDNLDPGTPVLVDASMRVDLLRSGWGRDDVETYDAATGALPERWTDAAWAVVPQRLADSASADSLTAADFDGLAVRRVLPGGVATATAADDARARLRTQLGAQLAQNTQLVISSADRALLSDGRVDDRIVSVLGALAALGPVEVSGFPVVDGEDGQPLRQVALATAYGRPLVEDGEMTAAARALVAGLLDQYAPRATILDGRSLILRYAPSLGEPAG